MRLATLRIDDTGEREVTSLQGSRRSCVRGTISGRLPARAEPSPSHSAGKASRSTTRTCPHPHPVRWARDDAGSVGQCEPGGWTEGCVRAGRRYSSVRCNVSLATSHPRTRTHLLICQRWAEHTARSGRHALPSAKPAESARNARPELVCAAQLACAAFGVCRLHRPLIRRRLLRSSSLPSACPPLLSRPTTPLPARTSCSLRSQPRTPSHASRRCSTAAISFGMEHREVLCVLPAWGAHTGAPLRPRSSTSSVLRSWARPKSL